MLKSMTTGYMSVDAGVTMRIEEIETRRIVFKSFGKRALIPLFDGGLPPFPVPMVPAESDIVDRPLYLPWAYLPPVPCAPGATGIVE